MDNKIELNEEDLLFIKSQYLKLKEHNRGVWNYVDLSNAHFNSKLQERNIELYFSILHDAISYKLTSYEDILSRNNLKEDFYKFYQGFISKVNKSEDYSLFLERKVEDLENRFGLVWKEQEEQLLKVISEREIIFGNGRFLIANNLSLIETKKSKKKEILNIETNTKYKVTRKKDDGFLYSCEEIDKPLIIYANNIYIYENTTYLEYYPTLKSKGNQFGFGNIRDNLLIEGDNYYILQLLQYTHRNKIDVIYIDPPYNTGNEDFKYNDSFVGLEDGGRHSKWLSFMDKRLRLAKKLLKKNGVIFISIGEEELAHVRLLCDSIFGEQNFISNISRIAKTASNKGKFFAPSCDYVLLYSNFVESLSDDTFSQEVDETLFTKEDDFGKYRDDIALYQSSLDPLRGCVNQRYYIECPDGTLVIPPGKTFPEDTVDAGFIAPQSADDKVWRWSYSSYLQQKHLLVFKETKTSPLLDENGNKAKYNIYTKSYLSNRQEDGVKPRNFLIEKEFLNRKGADYLKKIGIEFSYSKPKALINYLITLSNAGKDAIILDFFAGSGTTGEAVLELNKSDGGNRKYILCTNNEGKICEKITYERLLRINNPQKYGFKVDKLEHGLNYLKLEHVSKLDMKQKDILGSFENIKYIANLKFESTKEIELETNDFYITDTYAVLKKQNFSQFDLELLKEKININNIKNIVYLGSKLSNYKTFKTYFEKILDPRNIYFMSKDFMDYMLTIINNDKEINIEDFYDNKEDTNDKQ